MRGWVKLSALLFVAVSIGVVLTVYSSGWTIPTPPPPGIEYTEGATKYDSKMFYLFGEISEGAMPTQARLEASRQVRERAETKANATDYVVNTADLREAIAEMSVERGDAANIDDAYATLICPNEAKIGITFGTEPWTDAEDWGHTCP